MNFDGVFVGIATLLIIGLFHPIVIKAEYYFSEKIWPLFLAAGVLFIVISVYTNGVFSSIAAVLAVTCFWSIKELKEQTKRVAKGLYPKRKK